MLKEILMIISNIPIAIFFIKWSEQSTSKKTKPFNITLTITTLLTITITNTFLTKEIRLIALPLILIGINYFSYSKKIIKSVLSVIIFDIIVSLIEFSFVIIASLILKDNLVNFLDSTKGFLIISLYMAVVLFLIIRTTIPLKIFNKIYDVIKEINYKEAAFYLIVIFIILIITTIESYVKMSITMVLTINTLIAMITFYIIIKSSYVKSRYNKINSKFQISINSLKEYEMMIDRYRIFSHENKNELLTIRNMSNNKKVSEYIDKLIDNKIKDNETIMKSVQKIPQGGLRATLYSKMCIMEDRKINYKLDIANNLKTTDFLSLDDNITVSICRIINVFLDNSIEAVNNLEEKTIIVELYKIEDELYIDISNNYYGKIEIEKISKPKYSTKDGDNRGYGLALVEQIINDNKNRLKNEKYIEQNMFKQSLIIKM